MPRVAQWIELSPKERRQLHHFVRTSTEGSRRALHAQIVLLAGDGFNNKAIARALSLREETVGRWRRRFWIARLGCLRKPSGPSSHE